MRNTLLYLWLGFVLGLATINAMHPSENEIDDYAHKNHQEHPKSPASELFKKDLENSMVYYKLVQNSSGIFLWNWEASTVEILRHALSLPAIALVSYDLQTPNLLHLVEKDLENSMVYYKLVQNSSGIFLWNWEASTVENLRHALPLPAIALVSCDLQTPNLLHLIEKRAREFHDEVDIIKLMNVSAKDQGVSLVEGPIRKFPAYKFRLPYGNVPLANSTVVTSAMNNPNGFTIVFLIRQQKNNLGTLISVNSPGRLTPWFQLSSNSKTGTLTLKYRLQGSNRLRQVDWGLPKHHRKSPLAAWTWISVSVDFRTNTMRLDLDCHPSRFESITPGKEHERISFPEEALVYFRQEPGRKKKFLGSMQVAKVLPYVVESRLWSCLQISPNLAPGLRKPLLKKK
ncbi:hypothetical protein NQ315_007752 [Exocentrus adspersus]|uniref:Thrombospondin-like N-terminal domain-containing protein n=1 Tax=Exocentrus adspersus TaxID=1586481 RepID=A0AAV8W983_9CUCU|nr:hypothetical protein NQ315_007752 [Exocentrus adspersus]